MVTGLAVVVAEFVPPQCHVTPDGAVFVTVRVFAPQVLVEIETVAVGVAGITLTVTSTDPEVRLQHPVVLSLALR